MSGDIDKNANYWKVEARQNGFDKASDIDHLKPDPPTGLYLLELRGEL